MELIEMLQKRRSIRQYTGEPIPEEKIEKILQAGLLSFSGKAINPWEFILVKDKEMLQKMSGCRAGAGAMLKGADAAIVVLGDSDKSDTIVEDCSVVMAYMHLMADTLGVGSCWLQGRLRFAEDESSTEDYLRGLLKYPENYKLEAVLVMGMPAQHPEPHTLEDLQTEKIHKELF